MQIGEGGACLKCMKCTVTYGVDVFVIGELLFDHSSRSCIWLGRFRHWIHGRR